MRKKSLIVVIFIAMLAAGCGATVEKPTYVTPPTPQITVYVSGSVARPATYYVPPGTTVSQVINMAGGLTAQADAGQVDQEAGITGTTQLYIPRIGEPKSGGLVATGSAIAPNQVAAAADSPLNSAPARVYRPQRSSALSSQEDRMLDLVNAERANRGLRPLAMDSRLVEVARLKSQDMVENDYFAHQSPKYGAPSAMVSAYGISYHMVGENLAASGGMEEAHSGLMGSPGHRSNILQPNFTDVGIGIVRTRSGGVMITQLFIQK